MRSKRSRTLAGDDDNDVPQTGSSQPVVAASERPMRQRKMPKLLVPEDFRCPAAAAAGYQSMEELLSESEDERENEASPSPSTW